MINKWVIYLIETLSGIDGILGIVMFISGIIMGISFILTMICVDVYDKVLYERARKSLKLSIICFFVVCGVSSFIPNKETMYLMLISDYVTEENVEAGTEVVKETFDYVIDGIDKIVNGGENKDD